MLSDFFAGIKTFFSGIKLFYGNWRYWHYAIIPMLIILLLYGLGIWAYFEYLNPWLLSLLPDPSAHAAWLKYFIYPLRWLTATAAFLAGFSILLLGVTTIYTIFSSPFFDTMVAKIEKNEFSFKYYEPRGWKFIVFMFHSIYDSAVLNLITIFWTIVLFPLSFFVPVAGPVLYAAVVGYFFALSFLVYSAEHRCIRRRQYKLFLRGNRVKVLGFGLAAYILSLIPFAMILLLPAAVTGATVLFNRCLDTGKQN
ncbi:EI24 domain-containing protein [Lentisphaerota bacterium ZTH]|nr:EI24 domain-containing protein [Lentisphaerota bacterium ZTH]